MLEIRKVVRWHFLSGYSFRKIFFDISNLTVPNTLDCTHDPPPALAKVMRVRNFLSAV